MPLPDKLLLNISLIRCNDMYAGDWRGMSDPYCKIEVDGVKKAKSSIKYKTLNPEYYEIFHIPIKRGSFPPEKVSLHFWDWDMGPFSDEFLGSIEISGAPVGCSKPIDVNQGAVIQDYRILPFETLKNFHVKDSRAEKGRLGRLGSKSAEKLRQVSVLEAQGEQGGDCAPKPVSQTQPIMRKNRAEGTATFRIWYSRLPAELNEDMAGEEDLVYKADEEPDPVQSPQLRFLKVKVYRAEGLPTCKGGGLPPNPYVKVTFGDQVYNTKYQASTCNPEWPGSKFAFVVDPHSKAKSLSTMTVEMWHFVEGSSELLGTLVLPMKALMEQLLEDETEAQVKAMREGRSLKHPSTRFRLIESDEYPMRTADLVGAYGKPAGRLFFKLKLILEANGYQRLMALRPKVGELRGRILCGHDLRPAGTGTLFDIPDPYCVLKLGEYWMRTKTVKDETSPVWNIPFTFAVHELADRLTVVVFDDNHEGAVGQSMSELITNIASPDDGFMGRVVVPINTLQYNVKYKEKFPLVIFQAGEFLKKGSISMSASLELELELVVEDTKAALLAYNCPPMPTRFYYDPMDDVHSLERHMKAAIMVKLEAGVPPIRKEVSTAVYASARDEFAVWHLRIQQARIAHFARLPRAAAAELVEIIHWRSPIRTITAGVVWVVCSLNLHRWPAAFYLALLGVSASHLMRKPVSARPQLEILKQEVDFLESLRDEQTGGGGAVPSQAEHANVGKEKRTRNPVKLMKLKYAELTAKALVAQNGLFTVADFLERAEAVFTWEDRYASAMFFCFFFFMFLLHSLVPLRYLMAMGGVGVLIKKCPCVPNTPTPALPKNIFLRLPTKGFFVL